MKLVEALFAGAQLDAKEAAAKLGVKEPAARRQLRMLERELTGVVAERVSGRDVWRFEQTPQTWPVSAVVAACLGSSLAPLFEPGEYGGYLRDLRSKLITPRKKSARFSDVDRKFWFRTQGGDAGNNEGGRLDDLMDALLDQNRLRLSYLNRAGEEKEGVFEPLSLVVYQHQLYLVARHADGSLRPLRFSRIRALEVMGETFVYPRERPPDRALNARA